LRVDTEQDWQETACLFPVTLITGERAHGPLMTRVNDGVREYRRMTPEEQAKFVSIEAW
jgi:hypothetical protein